MTASTGPSGTAPGGHVRWRRRLIIGLAAALAVVWFTRSFGLRTAEIAGGGLLIATVAGLYLWRGPKLHKHLQGLRRGGGRSRTGSLNYPGQRGKGLPSLPSPGRKRLGGPGTGMRAGSRHRPAMAPFRRAGGAGPKAGSRHRRGLGRVFGPAGARRRPGGSVLSGRRGGSRSGSARRAGLLGGRRGLSGGSGASRRGSGRRFSPSRRRSGAFRGFGGSSGRSRGGSRSSGRTRPGSRGAGSRRRSLLRPSSWRRRPVSGPHGRGGAGGGGRGTRPSRGPGARRRIPFRRPGRRPAGSGPRASRPPGRVGRAWQRMAGTPSAPSRARRTWWRAVRGPARYARWRLRGSPGVPGSRHSRRLAARNRRRAWRRHLRANPALTRHRAWYAPWRIMPGGKPALRHRASRRFRTWRWRRRLRLPRNRQGRRLTFRERLHRRWRIWRGYPGSGAILLASQPSRRRLFTRWLSRTIGPRRWARRRQAPPRPMPAWTGAIGQRVHQHRTYRWLRGTGPVQPQPQPRRQQPTGVQYADSGVKSMSGPIVGAGTARGGHMTDQAQPAIDEIEQLGGWDPDRATDLDETIRSLSGISSAVAGSFRRIARTLEETGAHEDFASTLDTAANGISHHSSELEGHLSGGLMSHGGGTRHGTVPSAQVRGVMNTISELGGWDPDDPEELDETILSLSRVVHAVQASYTQIEQTLAGTGAHSTYPEHLHEAAGGIGSIADEVEAAFTGGVLHRPGS